jgi:hypothetical protein
MLEHVRMCRIVHLPGKTLQNAAAETTFFRLLSCETIDFVPDDLQKDDPRPESQNDGPRARSEDFHWR